MGNKLSLTDLEQYLKVGGRRAEGIMGIINNQMPFVSALSTEVGRHILEDALKELNNYHMKVHNDVVDFSKKERDELHNYESARTRLYNKAMYNALLSIIKRWSRRIEGVMKAKTEISETIKGNNNA
jgi:hypothetical protein